MTAGPEPVQDVQALADFAVKMRPELDRTDVEGAIVALVTAGQAHGWPWRRVMVQTVLMLAHGETPRDLRNAVRHQRSHVR